MRNLIAAAMQRRAIRFIIRLVRRYGAHDLAQQGAALAYYLLFSLFPILILVSSLIGQLELDISGILDTVSTFLPGDVLALAESYLNYAAEQVSVSMLWFSAVFSVWFPMRATRCLMRSVRRAYDLGPPKSRLMYTFKILLFTVLLLMCLVLTLLLMALGGRVMDALGHALSLPESFARLWGVLRFAALGTVVFLSLCALYAAAQDSRRSLRAILPGAALSTLAWIVLSSGYAFYAENISNYSVIYGALGAVVVILIWLYLTALTLIMGAELNQTLLPADDTVPQRDRRFDQGEML